MTRRNHKHAPADADPGQATTPTKAAIAFNDNNHNGKLVSEESIRLCAYQKWEAAGQPAGDGVQFWLEAEQELAAAKKETFIQRGGGHWHHEHERLEDEKAVKASDLNVDSHYRDNNRMFQSHGERGHRHGSR